MTIKGRMIQKTANLSLEVKDSIRKWNIFKVLKERKASQP